MWCAGSGLPLLSAAHDKAKARLIKVWKELNGYEPRTFDLDNWTTAEINEFTDGEIAEHQPKKDENKT